jgi:hypothetical protein
VFYTTFISAIDVIAKVIVEEKDIANSLLIIDESHNIISNDELCDFANKFEDLILMTGTVSDTMIEKCPVEIEAVITF